MPVEIFLDEEKIETLGPDFDQILIPSIGTTITWSGDNKAQTALICAERPKQSMLFLRESGAEGVVQVDVPIDTNLFGNKEVFITHHLKARRI